jgi:hypothetical protein
MVLSFYHRPSVAGRWFTVPSMSWRSPTPFPFCVDLSCHMSTRLCFFSIAVPARHHIVCPSRSDRLPLPPMHWDLWRCYLNSASWNALIAVLRIPRWSLSCYSVSLSLHVLVNGQRLTVQAAYVVRFVVDSSVNTTFTHFTKCAQIRTTDM